LNCVCHDTGSPTLGKCAQANTCQGTSAGGKGLDSSSLGQLGQLLGQLMQKLGQSSPSSGGAPAPANQTGCVSGVYYQTSDITVLSSDPCAQYQAPPITTPGSCDTLSSLLGTCNASQLSVSPSLGEAPLAVTFTAATGTMVDPGDNGSPVALSGESADYTYNLAGSYTATLEDASSTSLGTATVTVTSSTLNQNPDNTTATQVLAATGTAATTVTGGTNLSAIGSPLLLAPGITNGASGNILFSSNGTTIFGSSLDLANNTGVAGFFGSDTLSGQQPQGLAAQLCEARPWGGGFVGGLLPAAVFDGLCTARGFQVGAPPPPTAPVVQLQQTTPAPAAQTPAPVQEPASTTPAITPQVQIWAVPASVPLATRTSIFWNTQGVTDCTETSPDGSFNQNSLSGGAATQPLSGATTFTISCSDANGNPVTGYVTVNLSI
ncbi:MAG: hypothetical protein ACRD5L_06555, partial [Bryobacteraceae bacterium]